MLETLKDKFHDSTRFQDLKRLARRFALSFGLDLRKNRNAVVDIHVNGVDFVFGSRATSSQLPPDFDFLEILGEFSFKLLRSDKKIQLEQLKTRFQSTFSNDERLRPYNVYKATLQPSHAKSTPNRTSKSNLSEMSQNSTPAESRVSASDSPASDDDSIYNDSVDNGDGQFESTRVQQRTPRRSNSPSSSSSDPDLYHRNVRSRPATSRMPGLGSIQEQNIEEEDSETPDDDTSQTNDNLLDGFPGNSASFR